MRDNDVVAEYLTDNVPSQILPLTTLIDAYGQSVLVHFQNTTTDPVDIGWLHPDGGVRVLHPQVPSLYEVAQPCYAGHRWVILQGGEVIGSFMAGTEAEQTVDIGELAEHTLAAYDAIARGDAVPDYSTTGSNPPVISAPPVVGPVTRNTPPINVPANIPQRNNVPPVINLPPVTNVPPQNNVLPRNTLPNTGGRKPPVPPPIDLRTNPQPDAPPSQIGRRRRSCLPGLHSTRSSAGTNGCRSRTTGTM